MSWTTFVSDDGRLVFQEAGLRSWKVPELTVLGLVPHAERAARKLRSRVTHCRPAQELEPNRLDQCHSGRVRREVAN